MALAAIKDIKKDGENAVKKVVVSCLFMQRNDAVIFFCDPFIRSFILKCIGSLRVVARPQPVTSGTTTQVETVFLENHSPEKME